MERHTTAQSIDISHVQYGRGEEPFCLRSAQTRERQQSLRPSNQPAADVKSPTKAKGGCADRVCTLKAGRGCPSSHTIGMMNCVLCRTKKMPAVASIGDVFDLPSSAACCAAAACLTPVSTNTLDTVSSAAPPATFPACCFRRPSAC